VHDQSFFVSAGPLQYDRLPALVTDLLVAKAQAVLAEAELLRDMFDVGYFPPNTPPVQT
jgi:hypothetical protein